MLTDSWTYVNANTSPMHYCSVFQPFLCSNFDCSRNPWVYPETYLGDREIRGRRPRAGSRRVASIFIRGGTRWWRDWRSQARRGGAARREAPERQGGWDLGRSGVAPPQYGVWGIAPKKIFEKSMLKLHIFLWFYTSISNVWWRVIPVAKQSSVCNSGAKFYFQSMTGWFQSNTR